MCVLTTAVRVQAKQYVRDIDRPVPAAAKRLLAKSRTLIEHDQLMQATSVLKNAISIAPNYVDAHAAYILLQTIFLNRSDAVRTEYERLMKKEPDNPIYPMALAIGFLHAADKSKNVWLQNVIDLAPEWTWTHYARALLRTDQELKEEAADLKKYIDARGSWGIAYYTLSYIQANTLKKPDDAIATVEKMVELPNSRSWDLNYLWKLRLGKAGGTEEAKISLRNELDRLFSSSHELRKLDAARIAYRDLLDDKTQAFKVENKIRRIDPTWYPERGLFISISTRNISGIVRRILAPNRQYSNFNKIDEFSGEIEPETKILGLEQLLHSLKLSVDLKHYLLECIFGAAAKIKDMRAMITYGDLLFAAHPDDVAIPAKIAIAAADEKDIQNALKYANIAFQATATSQAIKRPVNYNLTDEEWNEKFPPEQQQKFYKRMRALALDALGWSQFQIDNFNQAETNLRQSIDLNRIERNLTHLSKVLNGLGQMAEAEKTAKEAKELYVKNIKQSFTNELSKDFELITIEGQRVKLSELKGKVVLIDFWATWCGPCIQSIPVLTKMYEKYKSKGLEILYISVDIEVDKYKVAPYAREKKIPFQVMIDSGVQDAYNIKGFPTTIFIDRQGNVRYREAGFTPDESPRMIETAIELLLQEEGF
jgi:thiol-disulfide isomerase/thioredoxin